MRYTKEIVLFLFQGFVLLFFSDQGDSEYKETKEGTNLGYSQTKNYSGMSRETGRVQTIEYLEEVRR